MNKSCEMTRIIQVRELTNKPKKLEWQADVEERDAIARRIKVLSVEDLKASIVIQKGDLIKVTGKVDAVVKQACVVTTEPVMEEVHETFEEFFCEQKRHQDPIDIDMESQDVDPIENGNLDVGELVIEYLSLGLNPYPRKADAPCVDVIEAEEEIARPNPFAVLSQFKKN